MSVKLGLGIGYWGARPPKNLVENAVRAEKMGYWGIVTAETYGSDALTPLTWIGAHTSQLKLCTSILQMSARTPAATAMHALTLDHLSGGRVILGIGVSGPQVVEGWYGQPFGKPLARTREYVSILRQVFEREQPVQNSGEHYSLPYPVNGANSWGEGKPLKSITHPLRSDLPIYLGAEGPKNVALAAEICDGWIPAYYSPYRPEVYRDSLKQAKPGFDVIYPIQVSIDDDLDVAMNKLRPFFALYLGGMGSKNRNFHNELFCRLGFEEAAKKVQSLYLEGNVKEATAAVPDNLIDEVALVGSKDRIRDRLKAYDDSPITGFVVGARSEEEMNTLADCFLDR